MAAAMPAEMPAETAALTTAETSSSAPIVEGAGEPLTGIPTGAFGVNVYEPREGAEADGGDGGDGGDGVDGSGAVPSMTLVVALLLLRPEGSRVASRLRSRSVLFKTATFSRSKLRLCRCSCCVKRSSILLCTFGWLFP